MKYCKQCGVRVETEREYCPLCFRELEDRDTEKDVGGVIFPERKTNEKTNKNTNFLTKLFIFMTICIIGVCGLVNYLADPELLWSLYVVSGVLYVWILVSHTIISRRGIFAKVVMQLIGIMCVVGVSDYLSVDSSWLPKYVFPSISMCTVTVLLIITFIRKDTSWLLSFVTITILLLVASVITLVYYDAFKLMNIISIVYCALTAFGYLTFGFSSIKQEFLKLFHL